MRTCPALLSLALIFLALPAQADRDPPRLSEYDRHDLRVTTICIEDHVVIVGHSDVGKGGGFHMMQLQQDVNGRIVPMRCDAEKVRMSEGSGDASGNTAAPRNENEVAGR